MSNSPALVILNRIVEKLQEALVTRKKVRLISALLTHILRHLLII